MVVENAGWNSSTSSAPTAAASGSRTSRTDRDQSGPGAARASSRTTIASRRPSAPPNSARYLGAYIRACTATSCTTAYQSTSGDRLSGRCSAKAAWTARTSRLQVGSGSVDSGSGGVGRGSSTSASTLRWWIRKSPPTTARRNRSFPRSTGRP